MKLNDDEQRVLQGEQGDIARKCMEFLVSYGEAADAPYLIDLNGTVDLHPGINWVTDFQITEAEVTECAERGEKFKIPTYANKATAPGFIYDNWQKCGTLPNSDPDYHQNCLDSLASWIKMGMVPTFSCDSYLVISFLPSIGQNCAWVESSAIPYGNAVLGARTNFDGCFQTAYLGKVPFYDMHVDENRAATMVIKSETPLRNDMEFDLFGWVAGEIAGLEVPALVGTGTPTTSQVVKMNSSLNTAGNVRMYHIPGVTPEAPSLEAAFQGNKIPETVIVTRDDLKKVYEKMNYASTEQVDFVYLGCPHYNIEEIKKVAQLLESKKCKIPLWVMTNPLTFRAAEIMGLDQIIEKAGGVLLSGSCCGLLNGEMPPAKVMAVDAAKQDYYLTGTVYPEKLEIWYGTTEDCINTAVSGKWEGEWRK